MIPSFSYITPNYQNLILFMAIRLISDIIDIVSATSVSNNKNGLSKIVLISDKYTFLIASDIRYIKIHILMPLLLSDMAGAVNILYTLRYFIPSCMDC